MAEDTPAANVRELSGRRLMPSPTVCPHCGVRIATEPFTSYLGMDQDGALAIQVANCTNGDCGRLIVELVRGEPAFMRPGGSGFLGMSIKGKSVRVVNPPVPLRKPLDPTIPERYRDMVTAATAILGMSPEASATLTRRALQSIFFHKFTPLPPYATTAEPLSPMHIEVRYPASILGNANAGELAQLRLTRSDPDSHGRPAHH
jgi:hypothetical protein